jgi:transposase InsO family protein
MVLAQMVVDAVVLEGRGVRDVARAYGVSKTHVSRLVARFREGGYQALAPRSRRPHSSPGRISDALEDEIVALRKELCDLATDAGAETIAWHLEQRHGSTPSTSTIHRALVRRGFVTPEPKKRPKASYVRFAADLPNECWQGDMTHWHLGDGTEVEILNFIDDHSRLIVVADARPVTKGLDVLATFERATLTWGTPASVLTDNGAIFNAGSRHGRSAFESDLIRRRVLYKHSRPYHPQTCGKIERWHQTMKKFLAKAGPASDLLELQAQIDSFVYYYNNKRPHRSCARRTPRQAFDARPKAAPGSLIDQPHHRIRFDVVDKSGKVSLRHHGKMLHIGVGHPFKGQRVRLYIVDDYVRVLTDEGELLGELTIDVNRDYQAMRKPS